MRNRDRCGSSLRGERKGWAEGSKHRVDKSPSQEGAQGGWPGPPASRPLGPGNRDHFTGEKKTLGQGLHFENSEQASTQAWRVRVTPTSILATLLHFTPSLCSKSQWASQGGCQSHLESEPPCLLRAPWTLLGSLLEGALHSCYGLGHGVGGEASGPLSWCPWPARGQFPNQCMRSVSGQNWCSRVICREKAGGSA